MRKSSLAAAAAIAALGVPLETLTAPKHIPVRQLTEEDAQRIAAALQKRERKAAKRAAAHGDKGGM